MRIRDLLMFVLGTAVGGAGVFYLSPPRELVFPHVQAAPETFRLLVAKRKLNYGAILRPKDLQWVEWPENVVPPGAFTSVEELLGEQGDQKRIVLRSIGPGEPVLESKITKFGESPRMSMNLSARMRAVSIKIDAVSGVAGFIKAGDRVDILLTRTQQGQLVSSVILQNVSVLAAGPVDDSKPRAVRTVTLAVTTTQAQTLAVAQQVGKLSLTLRDTDQRPNRAPGASGFLPPGVAAPRRPRRNTISDFPITPGVFPGYDEP